MDSEEGDIVRALATIIIQRAESTYVSDPRIPCCLIGSRYNRTPQLLCSGTVHPLLSASVTHVHVAADV